jgi:hypothetical protein
VVGETVVPGILGVLWLGDSSRPGLAWLAVLGFVLAVAGAVAVAWFGESGAPGSRLGPGGGSLDGDGAAVPVTGVPDERPDEPVHP